MGSPFKSAFVHFHQIIREAFWETIYNNGNAYNIQITQKEYWLCLKNKNPIQRTMMNIHQVVDNGAFVEKMVYKQAQKIKEQKNTINELKDKVHIIQETIYELLTGLYCEKSQYKTLSRHLYNLHIIDKYGNKEDTNIWKQLPTTRQGDECENRLDFIEKYLKISNAYDTKNGMYNENQENQDECDKSIENDYVYNSYDYDDVSKLDV
jgi:hypothetical protein